MKSVPMLFVPDVEAASAWYQALLGVTSGHGGPEFEMLLADGTNLLQLHAIETDHHDHGVEVGQPLGHGVMVVIYVDDAAACYARAQELALDVTGELGFNERANMDEFTLRDPHGYSLMICTAKWA